MKIFFSFKNSFFFLTFIIFSQVNSQTLEQKITELISKMTLEEKIKQLHQQGSFNTEDNVRLNIPGFYMSDGPHGVRNGFATSFPVGIGMAATWDRELSYRIGEAMGKEFRSKGIHQALGPCLDLTMDPRNGRTPESTSEDPILNAIINTALVQGIQSTPTLATIKHFYTEYRQNGRTTNNYTLSNRNLLEQHALQFREAIQIGGAFSVMSSYNSLNGKSAAKNSTLLSTILRTKWGFPFYVVSDWNSIYSNPDEAINAGCDIEMGSTLFQSSGGLLDLVKSGKLSETAIDKSVRRVLRTKFLSGMMNYYPQGDPADLNSTAHQQLALEAGKKSLVLLKNQDNILPLNKNKINKIAVIGPNAAVMQTDGSGSSWVDPFYKVSPKEGIEKYVGASKVLYAKGCEISGSNYSSDLSNALNFASQSDVVIFFGGLDNTQEGEGFDRVNNSIELPGKQKDLIKLLSSVNKNLIVVLISGGICTATPFIDDIKGLIYGFYPGQEGGNAIAQVLFGDYNPSGKLPVTMPTSDSQLPDRMNNNLDNNYGGGYRWFDRKNFVPQFPFGFGLSYTTFELSNFQINHSSWAYWDDEINISVDVTNKGNLAGEEVVQLYISIAKGVVEHNPKDLKAFEKIYLEPGQTKTVTFNVTPDLLYYFRPQSNSYEFEPGPHVFRVGNSSANLTFAHTLDIRPRPPKPDLQIANVYTVPRYPIKGEKVIFLATILNRGTGPSPASIFHEVTFKINGKLVSRSYEYADSIAKGGMVLVCGNIGETINDNNYWIAEKPGSYTVEVFVDEKNAIQETNENNNKKLYTFKVYDTPTENLAYKKQTDASSLESLNYLSDYAVDGNYSTRWSSQFSDPQYFKVDLGEQKYFNEIRIFWETAYGKEYIIEVSNDNLNWKKIIEQKNGNGNIEKWIVNETARYIKLTGIKRGTLYGYSIYEFEVYNRTSSSVDNYNNELPTNFELYQNYPNPFNPSTTINFKIPKSGHVKLNVYNSIGELVTNLIDNIMPAGNHSITFDANRLPSGVYIYTISTNNIISSKKMMLIK
ncbi:glycoside hydrolase family 3 C-terminal domain-containing protein [Stygiobacter electus]|uniref:Glycoside hydrolase family 3 C-terminal domain-containing protein n=1 Tax=Stygiobacter electus TaxID=3032292 RepID=A0AAE3TE13_9BACT|nr:glycoside hydrolase family 3 C-terminal domain-containing protein [Stygiobacter electus]MDF1613051.1 glycoside hydrolase family 3 C-terminal domain-containing protein [Stygiobacter electus]